MHVGNCCCQLQDVVVVRSQALVYCTCCVRDGHDVKNMRCRKTSGGNSYTVIAVLELSSSVTVFILIFLPAGLLCCESVEGECTSIQAGLAFN